MDNVGFSIDVDDKVLEFVICGHAGMHKSVVQIENEHVGHFFLVTRLVCFNINRSFLFTKKKRKK